tara:strand:+ start:25033 stop:26091 length:1059 start_codon:yes stop_codon:yes gene_type:complete
MTEIIYPNGLTEGEIPPIKYTNWWESDRSLNSYEQMVAFFNRARDKTKGKPVTQWSKLTMEGDVVYINLLNYGTDKLAKITPDNIIEFIAEPMTIWQQSQSMVGAFHRWYPFTFMRHRKGLYRAQHTKVMSKIADIKVKEKRESMLAMTKQEVDDAKAAEKYYGYWNYGYQVHTEIMKESPSYFKGLRFHMLTGECLNQRPDDKFVEDPEKRKEWRKMLTKFKRGMKARIKVHALDGIVNEVWDNKQLGGQHQWKQPDWSAEEWTTLLQKCIRDCDYPRELLIGLVQTSHSGYYMSSRPTADDLRKTLDRVLNDMSIELRRRFGVFEKEGHDEKKQDKYRGYNSSITIEGVL